MTALKSSVLVALLGAVGIGDQVLSSVGQAPRDVLPHTAVGLPMPKTPFPGQKKPPCDPEYELAALGACWAIFEKKPPCGDGGYEYAGKCVRASYDSAHQPTSEDLR
jgi:hypothetical protein